MIFVHQTRFRSIFISDFHLGSPHCEAGRLSNFLATHNAERIYLVGDIIEANNHLSWPAAHCNVIKELSNKLQTGTEIFYIPGNHDRIFLNYVGDYNNLQIARCVSHTMVDGKVLLVTHGDQIDRFKSWTLLHILTAVEKVIKKNLWELLRKYLRYILKRHELKFEQGMIDYARARGFYGVVCGHVHFPKIETVVRGGAIYINAGDWIYHCTAVVEHWDGRFELLRG
jgi:UDP-2,3-diacylglucosamine pyrophosphatase LpxH